MWLRDFLPDILPEAKIMTFGYDSRWFLSNGRATIRESAKRLLALLISERGDAVG
jgi:hypothetical protein